MGEGRKGGGERERREGAAKCSARGREREIKRGGCKKKKAKGGRVAMKMKVVRCERACVCARRGGVDKKRPQPQVPGKERGGLGREASLRWLCVSVLV